MTHPTGIYQELGVRRVINLYGAVSLLGGSSLGPGAMRAMAEANADYAVMHELLDRAGATVARLLGSEAACLSTGTAGGLALAAAAVMAGQDLDRIARLPDTTGMPHMMLIQGPVGWLYERAVTQTGARLVRVGTPDRCTVEDIERAIGPDTAALVHVANTKVQPPSAVAGLDGLVAVGRAHGIPVIADAAGPVLPVASTLRALAGTADLACFGAKYLDGPGSVGFVCGRADLVAAVRAQDFLTFDELGVQGRHGGIGRGLKVDRGEAVAAVVALQEWLELDHAAWQRDFQAQLAVVEAAVARLPGVGTSWAAHHDGSDGGGVWLRIAVDAASPRTAQEVARVLAEGDPGIWVAWTPARPTQLALGSGKPGHLRPGEEHLVAARLVAAFEGPGPVAWEGHDPAALAHRAPA